MPDTELKTISGTECAGLFNRSPYTTRFTLHAHFTGEHPIPFEPDVEGAERLEWGKRLEPAIIEQAAKVLRLEGKTLDLRLNPASDYMRHPTLPLGCTRDAALTCPQRGLGIVQAKNVDWFIHNDSWFDEAAPPHIELQLQHEMLVHGAKWGAIAALIGGNELRIIERKPNEELQQQIIDEAHLFMASVNRREPPDPLGVEIELPALASLYPTDKTETLELMDDEPAAQLAADYTYWKKQEKEGASAVRTLRPKLVALAGTAHVLRVHGNEVKINKIDMKETTATRKAHTQTRLAVKQKDDGPMPEAWEKETQLG